MAERFRSTHGRRVAGLAGAVGLAAALAATTIFLTPADAPMAQPRLAPLSGRFGGVNLAGGEFAGKRLPGRYGYDYSYPDAKTARPFVEAGLGAVRVPVRWERLQPTAMGPLDATELERLDRSLRAMAGFGVVVLDVHNYARYRGQRLDRPPASGAMLADLWRRLATRYRDRREIAFGMMNEPFGVAAADWRAIADETIRAIRETGARNLVLVPGTRWTGAHSWERSGNAAAMRGFSDPAGNFAFELHQYLDGDSSGTSAECVKPERAAARLEVATEWLRRERVRGVLAEFGAGDGARCLAGVEAMLRAMDADRDVWLGWIWWAAGGRWNKKYPLNIQPGASGAEARMRLLARYSPRRDGAR